MWIRSLNNFNQSVISIPRRRNRITCRRYSGAPCQGQMSTGTPFVPRLPIPNTSVERRIFVLVTGIRMDVRVVLLYPRSGLVSALPSMNGET